MPNPFKIACHVILTILQETALVFETLLAIADTQDAVTDGAEIEAGYENTKNLLQKQCAIYDQAVCRCVKDEHLESYGIGCDGKDSNCNDFVDECDEDTVPPTIDISNSLCVCDNGGWFANTDEALSCVENSVKVEDDCQTTNFTLSVLDQCEDSIVTVTAEDYCGNDAIPKNVTVQIDGEAPYVGCGFEIDGGEITHAIVTSKTGPSVLLDTKLVYTAKDNCNGPLNVTVKVYSNEIEDFNAQKLALFHKTFGHPDDAAGLYVAQGICTATKNGQCIKEVSFPAQRLYTIEVIAVDPAGLSNRTECFVEVQPKGNNTRKIKDIAESKQRFLLAEYFSTFELLG